MKKYLKAYERSEKVKFLLALGELEKRIKGGQLKLISWGIWKSNGDNSVFIKINLVSKDSSKEINRFEEFS